jgi:hypothetical protein
MSRHHRNRGQFGTASRAITDHARAQRQAALILEVEHVAKKHAPGTRTDLCPRCQDDNDGIEWNTDPHVRK